MILRVLLASDDERLRTKPPGVSGDRDVLVSTVDSLESLWASLRSRPCDLLVVDGRLLAEPAAREVAKVRALPAAPEVVVLLEDETAEVHADLLEAGALACIGRGMEPRTLQRALQAIVRHRRRSAIQQQMAQNAGGREELLDFVSESPAMRTFLDTVRKVVRTNSTLLVLGETGVGKEHLARAIHAESGRGGKPFVAVNCAALPEGLLESELFGHVAGAFTGAQRARRGYFELAHSGTIFLDEVGELPLHLQVKLLRVLQDRRVQPVGAERTIDVDVRVVAATNRDLKAETEAGRFRSDLYYRLGVITLLVPPLRERREDIPDLVESNVLRFSRMLGRTMEGVHPEALDVLRRYDWPGNVRELINVVERAVLLGEQQVVTIDDLPDDLVLAASPPALPDAEPLDELAHLTYREAKARLLRAFERRYLEQLLTQTNGRVGEAARRASLTPRSLYDMMKRHGLSKEAFRPHDPVRPGHPG